MAVAAQIKFAQGLNVGIPGRALEGVVATPVDVTNGNDANVVRWVWSFVAVPPGSAVPLGLVSDGPANGFSFSPDLRGGYHVELFAYDIAGNFASDRRVFQVAELSGRRIPPFDATASALNFSGGLRGWAPMMEPWLYFVDGPAPRATAATGTINNQTSATSGIEDEAIRFTGAAPGIAGIAGGRDGRRLVVIFVNAGTIKNEAGTSTAANRILTGTGADLAVPAATAIWLRWDSAIGRWVTIGGAGSGLPAPGTSGNLLTSNGSAWTSAPVSVATRLTPIDANHLHAWELDDVSGTLVDTGSSASKVNLPITAGTAIQYESEGLVGKCVHVGKSSAGVTGTVTAAALTSSFSDLPTGDLTVEIWYRSDVLVPGAILEITKNGSVILTVDSNVADVLTIGLLTGAGFSSQNTDVNVLASQPGVWRHLAVTYVLSTGTVLLYINGEVFYRNATHSGAFQWGSGTTPSVELFKSANNPAINQFHGQMSRFRISNIARSQAYLRAVFKKAMLF